MKILHLYSNWKWTGPAEHALQLAYRLSLKGHKVIFAYGRPPEEDLKSIRHKTKTLDIETVELRLKKHLNFIANLRDLWELSNILKNFKPDILHTHLTNDHLLGGTAVKLFSPSTKVIRTSYDGGGPKPSLRNKFLLGYLTSGLIAISEKGKGCAVRNFTLPVERVWKVEVGVDTLRFDPQSRSRSLRNQLGIGPSEVVVGIVARIQRHRRFDVLLDAFKQASNQLANLRAIIVGRGTNMVPVAVEPARELGLNGKVLFPGYKEGEEYVDTLASMDIKVFLVPGTDGACRAVREAMAMGLPIIVANRGMLPEIVKDGETGFVVEDTPENLSNAIIKLATDETLRKKMGQAARKWAVEKFSLDLEAEQVEDIYQALLNQ